MASELRDAPLFRIQLEPTWDNGPRRPSQVMIDKPQTIARDRIGRTIGRLDDAAKLAVNRALAVFLEFA